MKNLPLALLLAASPAAAQTYAGSAARVFAPAPAGILPSRATPAGMDGFVPSLPPSLNSSAPSLTLSPAPAIGGIAIPAALAIVPSALTPSLAVRAAAARPERPAAKDAVPAALASVQLSAAAAPDEKAPAANSGNVFDGSKTMYRPAEESWVVDGKAYATTAELVRSLPKSAQPVAATYTFSHGEPKEPSRPLANGAIGAFTGGVVGALLGTIGMILLAGIADIISTIVFFQPGGGVDAGVLIMGGAIGLIGAGIGASVLWGASKKNESPSKSYTGRITRVAGPEGEILYFEAGSVMVDLAKHALALPTPAPSMPAPWPAWKRALAGAGLGLGLAAWYWTPFAMILAYFMGPAGVSAAFAAKTAGTGINGGALGAGLGTLLTVGAFASYFVANTISPLIGFAVLAGPLVVLGTVLGLWAANAYRSRSAIEDAREPKGQWWTTTSGS